MARLMHFYAEVCIVPVFPGCYFLLMRGFDGDVIIAGGGMVGLSLGLALARAGIAAIVLERGNFISQAEAAFDGRVSAIALSSQRMLSALGAWEAMAPRAQPIRDIRVSDGKSPFFLHYHHREVTGEPFGWIVENRFIRAALADAAIKQPGLKVLERVELKEYESDTTGVTVCHERNELRARLLAGADGKYSRVRALAGIGALEANYGQTAIVCTIAHEKPHHGLAQERFLPSGPFAVLPMTENRSSLVWVERAEHAPHFLNLPAEECEREITRRVGGYLGRIRIEGARFSYPLGVMHAASYGGRRVALVGDAAHAIHPIAGQGVNLGWRDVAALAETLAARFALGLDIGDEAALSRYTRWRRFDNLTMLSVTDALNRLFSNEILPVQLARGLGLWGVSHLPPLKRFFMRHAMGLAGDVPPLMQAIE